KRPSKVLPDYFRLFNHFRDIVDPMDIDLLALGLSNRGKSVGTTDVEHPISHLHVGGDLFDFHLNDRLVRPGSCWIRSMLVGLFGPKLTNLPQVEFHRVAGNNH
ncbi:MAG: hypothetical protein N2C12_14005, partial [Planctomycetales bacterium]